MEEETRVCRYLLRRRRVTKTVKNLEWDARGLHRSSVFVRLAVSSRRKKKAKGERRAKKIGKMERWKEWQRMTIKIGC